MTFRKILILSCLAWPSVAAAQRAQMPATIRLPGVNVVATTPLLGSGVAQNRVPQGTYVLGPRDINRTAVPSLTDAMVATIPSASITDVDGNSFQPDINFHGFTASPVTGTAQGLAVYVNGVRFNDPFGETVNWDLIPPEAIQSVNVEASNPVFGLNALGGAVVVQMKNGFTFSGGDVTAYGGSYGRASGSIEYGRHAGNHAAYFAADITHDGGFRQTQTSDLYRLYTDFSWRNAVAEANLGITAANTSIGNPGATPVQALNHDISSIFSGPNTVHNKYVAINLNGSYALDDSTSLQGLVYFRDLSQRLPNGVTEELAACPNQPGILCNTDPVTPVTTTGGALVPDFLNGGLYSGLVQEGVDQQSYGASAEVTNLSTIAGMDNHFVAGASFDGSNTTFSASTYIGGITPVSHLFIGPGVVVDQPSLGVNPVRVGTTTRYVGLYFNDLLSLTPHLDLTLSGRFNHAQIDLTDKLGGPVYGNHSYSRFNPGLGLTWHPLPDFALYGSYTESNRTPSPTELSCASAAHPCSLLNFFVGDPNLKQVVARTFEGGLRGHLGHAFGGTLRWNADYFHTTTRNDIIYQPTLNNPNLQFYTNGGDTLRQGLEATVQFATKRLEVKLGYAFIDATFQNNFFLNSPSNPAANANGQIHVLPGDRIPGIPQNRGTIVVDYQLTPRLTIGGSAILQSSAYRFGDEANLTKPVGGYAVFNLNGAYRVTKHVTLFAMINNVTNRRYDTYGGFGPVSDVPWNFVPGGVTDPRTANPGQPISGYGGVKVTF